MEQANEPLVVGVRFSKVGKIYHFAADAVTDIKVGDQVVVETSRGWQLGQVAQIIPNADPPPDGWKAIDRRATPRDLLLRQMWQMKESEVVTSCRDRANELRLAGIKIVSAEYSFDGSRLSILFSSETEEKYDLKSLRSDMQKMFAPSQVEMRQVGPRDVAKVMCGMGACGLETRCCCLFLTEFSSISIRMAKEQGISLTPTEITGMCGRLRCCLIYEYDTYVDARSKLPKRNKRVRTPQGEGKVVDIIPLRGAVLVDLPEVGVREFPGEEVQIVDGEGGQQPGQQPAQPFKGTQQASEIDKAITGDESLKPFTVSAETPPPASDWENPPSVDRPRSMPRPDRPRPERQDRPRRGGGGRDQQPGQGPKTPPDPQERGARPDQGGRPPRREGRPQQPGDRPGGQPGGRPGGQQGGRPGDRPGGQPGGRPGGQQGGRQGNRPPRPQGERPERPQGGEPGGQQPGGQEPKPPSGDTGGNAPRGNRDQRRRKGRRHDSSDNQERA